ncbi:MAG: molybdopterin oxidoreductase family protein [Chloroflexota bacterium]|nr:molybdopterin oxidoreductase family protein [Chloroflexota bacterium]
MTLAPPAKRLEVKTVICPHDCPDTCAMTATIEDGRVVKMGARADQPFTKGFLCVKTQYYQERLYSPLRVLYPQRRVGPKGSGQFERISWDAALALIAERFQGIIAEYGAEAILPYSYAGAMGKLAYASMDRRFFGYMGASLLDRTICSTTGTEAYKSVMGTTMGTDPEGFGQARLIIAWGTNPVSTNVHLMPYIHEARRAGATFVVVDPHRSKTAEQADLHIRLNPGTDAALVLAMIHVLVREGLHNAAFLAQHTIGWEALAARAADWPPERAAPITGLTAEAITDFARLYATSRPSAIRLSYGMTRHTNGGQNTRAVLMLPAVTGAWGTVGGGALLSTSGTFGLNAAALERPDLLARHARRPRTINMIQLAEALTELHDPPVKGLLVYNSNPANVAPDQSRVLAGLGREDLFTVVHEQVMTDTARWADLVLPATTAFEYSDLYSAYGHLYVQLSRPAIPAMGEAIPNTELFRRLAAAMGYHDPCFGDSDDDLIRQALTGEHPFMAGITLERLEAETFIHLTTPTRPFVPFADGVYPTPSGKIELYSESLLRQGVDPVIGYVPEAESPDGSPALAARYPIRLLTPAAHHFLNTSFAEMPTMRRKQRRPTIELHPSDAATRGISDGVWVRAFNDRGEAFFVAEVKDSVGPGVACHLSRWWGYYSPAGWNANALTATRPADIGAGGTFHTNLVQVEVATQVPPTLAALAEG